MADAATGFLLENLTQLLTYNAELVGDSKNQVEGLLHDLNVFKGFIKEYTEKRISNPTLQALVNNIRSVVERAEDSIDKFVVEKATFKAKNLPLKAFHALNHSLTIRNVAKEIETIRYDVSEIYTKKQFGFNALQNEPAPTNLQKPPIVEEDNVVGFDEEAKTVINRLMEKDEDLDIITIIGMPGLGKTTLARKIYNDPAIEYEFFTRAWVFVSQTFSKKEVILSILNNFEEVKNLLDKGEDVIYDKLRQHLEKGKYLIVMDDVWTKEAWDDLKRAFPNNKKGSRILITSRNNHVARHVNLTKDPHDLKFLTHDESWELLEKKVFGKEKCPDKDLENIGGLIAEICKGLPLAIVVIAGILLNNHKSSGWWNQVAQNVKTFIITEQEQLLALSYNHLPYHLKSCFIYLGIFPEDYEIPVWKLIRLWIAEGFIEQEGWGNLSLEDIAEALVEDLVNRNLLMVAERRSNGQIKTCRVHDILHDFCKSEARKQKLYQEIEDSEQRSLDKYRRICIHKDVQKYIRSKPSGDRVRSFLSFVPDEINLLRDQISVIPKAFQLLRVLEIRPITFDIFPKAILELALLRYIAITCNIKSLPPAISRLWNMQTMIFLTNCRTLELKGEMWKMYQLRHLHTNACASLPPPPSKLQESRGNVQSLSMISVESCTKEVFARTPNIQKLGVRGKLVELFDKMFDSVGKLQHLTSMKLVNDVFPGQPSDYKISSLPLADKFPRKLQRLTLSDTSLDWKLMEILGNLDTLEVLKLKDNACKGRVWEPKDKGFPSLKFLHIGRTDLVTWKASNGHFPSLKRLVLQHCDKLNAVPSGFSDIASFQILELYRTNKQAAASAKIIQDRKTAKEAMDTKTGGGFKLAIYPPDI